MPETFHFLRPEWFLTLLPLALLLWRVRKPGSIDSAWRRVCDANLLPYLLISPHQANARLPVWLLAAGWLIAVMALADPVWEKQPQPVFRTEEARVVVLDLSRSMATPDLKPSRLERARYKVEDVLRRSREGQVGLVAFAGDAFVVAPLTHDAGTIAELLKALEPGLMPVQGSRADLGLRKAGELLAQAGAGRGEILLIGDGYEGRQALEAAGDLKRQGYTVSVLGVGTEEGAPLSNGSGGYVRDDAGAIVVPRLDTPALRALADAGGGRYATITGNDADLDGLLTPLVPRLDTKVEQTGLKTDAWRSRGPWLAVLLLPLAALAFRRGWLLVVVLLVAATVTAPDPAKASTWDDLWTRRDQQAAQALAAGENARAAELAADPRQRGTAQYRAGRYEEALAAFAGAGGPDAAYNQGNALARLGRYQEAIAAYDQALAAQPHMEDAQHNKAVVEALLRQQEKQEQERQQQDKQQDSSSNRTNSKGSNNRTSSRDNNPGRVRRRRRNRTVAVVMLRPRRARRASRGKPARGRMNPPRRLRTAVTHRRTRRRSHQPIPPMTLNGTPRPMPMPRQQTQRNRTGRMEPGQGHGMRIKHPHPAPGNRWRRRRMKTRIPTRSAGGIRRAGPPGTTGRGTSTSRSRAGRGGNGGKPRIPGCTGRGRPADHRGATGHGAVVAAHPRRSGRVAAAQISLPVPAACGECRQRRQPGLVNLLNLW